METRLIYIVINRDIEESKDISVICKDLVSWVKKTSLTKEVATFKNCCFLLGASGNYLVRKKVHFKVKWQKKVQKKQFVT